MQPDPNPQSPVGDEAPVPVIGAAAQPVPSLKRGHRIFNKKAFIVFVAVLNLAMLGLNIDLYALPNKSQTVNAAAKPAAKTVTATEKSKLQQAKTIASSSPTTLHYISTNQDYAFDYPVDWRIDSYDKAVNLTSGQFSYKLPDGTTETGKIQINIDDGTNSYSTLFFSDAKIAANSENVAYANPTAVQRSSTNLSYVDSETATVPSGFDTVVVTGTKSYRTGSTIHNTDLANIHPVVSAYVDTCQDHCQGLEVGEITPALLQTDPNLSQIKTIIASMRFN